jgi:hypothetical protein
MPQLLSDSDLGIGSGNQALLTDADLGLLGQHAPQSFSEKMSALWEHPPAGPSLIGAAKSLYDAVLTPGETVKAANDQAAKTEISDSDVPLSSGTMVAPAANMAANVMLPAPGVAGALKVLPAAAEKPAYGANSIQRTAADIVSAPLKDQGINTAAAAESALGNIAPEAVLADLDPRLTQLAGTLAAKTGPAQQAVRVPLEARNAAASQRITGTTNDLMGEPVDLGAVGQQIYGNAKNAVKPLYSEAYSVPIQSTPELEATLATPVGKVALSKAKNLALNDINGATSVMFNKQTPIDLSKTFSPDVLENMPERLRASLANSGIGVSQSQNQIDVRGLHLVRQAFDDMIQRAKSPLTSAGKNSLAALQANRAVVDKVLKQVEPMKKADSIFSNMADIQDAIKNGLQIFKNSQTPEDVASALKDMTAAERAAYIQAARVAVRNVMGTARNDAAAARGLFSKEFNQEKLKLALGEDAADGIIKRLDAEKAFANTDQRVLRNSETAARAYGKEALDQAHGIPSYRDVAVFSGIHGIARRAAIGGVSRVLDAAASGRQQAIEEEVAKLLTLDRKGRAQILSALFQEGSRRDPSGRLNAAIMPIVLEHSAAEDRKRLRSNRAR